jgi:DNA-binding CsgD family transcriptional regulator/N-acetylneuraminic acid mutarotase
MTDETQISEREREILRLVATGATNQQIAHQLNISINTVKVHLRNIFGKIGVVSRTEATLYAVRAGLVSVERAEVTTAVADEPEEAIAEPTPIRQAEPPPEPSVSLPLEAPPIIVPAPPPAEPETVTAEIIPTTVTVTTPSQQPSQLSPLVIAMAAVTLLAVTGLIAVLLLRPDAPAPTPTASGDVSLPDLSERWRSLAPLTAPRSAFAIAAANIGGANYLYAIGGNSENTVSGDVLRYDVARDSWARYSAKPTSVADVQAAVVGGRIYVPGGRTADGGISDLLEVYDPQSDRWSSLAAMPGPRSRYALAAVEGKIYLFGGWDGSGFTDQVWQYTPDTDSWAELGPMEVPRADAGAATLDGQVYLLGGENADGLLTRHERYNPADEGEGNPWTIRAPLPEARSRMGVTAAIDRVFVLGGAGSGGAISYETSRDAWQPVPLPENLERADLRALAIGNNRIYIIGGSDDGVLSDETFEYLALFTVMVPISSVR